MWPRPPRTPLASTGSSASTSTSTRRPVRGVLARARTAYSECWAASCALSAARAAASALPTSFAARARCAAERYSKSIYPCVSLRRSFSYFDLNWTLYLPLRVAMKLVHYIHLTAYVADSSALLRSNGTVFHS